MSARYLHCETHAGEIEVGHLVETDQWWKCYFGDSFEFRQHCYFVSWIVVEAVSAATPFVQCGVVWFTSAHKLHIPEARPKDPPSQTR